MCPSRGRPKAAADLLESFDRTRATNEVALLFLVDSDDPTWPDYPPHLEVGQPTGDPTGPLNRAAIASKSSILGFCGDDTRFETQGWDNQVLDALKSPGFCWGDDGHSRPWPSTVFISRRIVKALGYMVPPTLRRGFFDVVWVELAHMTGLTRTLPDVMFRHDNSAGDPQSPNFRPEAQVHPEVIASDEQAFHRWMAGQRYEDVMKIMQALP